MKINNPKKSIQPESVLVILFIAAIALIFIINDVIGLMYKYEYEREITDQISLIKSHYNSKSGNFVISFYQTCIETNTPSQDTKTECMQQSIDAAKRLETPELTEEGIRHLREYLSEVDEYYRIKNPIH